MSLQPRSCPAVLGWYKREQSLRASFVVFLQPGRFLPIEQLPIYQSGIDRNLGDPLKLLPLSSKISHGVYLLDEEDAFYPDAVMPFFVEARLNGNKLSSA